MYLTSTAAAGVDCNIVRSLASLCHIRTYKNISNNKINVYIKLKIIRRFYRSLTFFYQGKFLISLLMKGTESKLHNIKECEKSQSLFFLATSITSNIYRSMSRKILTPMSLKQFSQSEGDFFV